MGKIFTKMDFLDIFPRRGEGGGKLVERWLLFREHNPVLLRPSFAWLEASEREKGRGGGLVGWTQKIVPFILLLMR